MWGNLSRHQLVCSLPRDRSVFVKKVLSQREGVFMCIEGWFSGKDYMCSEKVLELQAVFLEIQPIILKLKKDSHPCATGSHPCVTDSHP
jgi:hypothetical protein